jgi:hypothetical protein
MSRNKDNSWALASRKLTPAHPSSHSGTGKNKTAGLHRLIPVTYRLRHHQFFSCTGLTECRKGVCSIFLQVDRSINEIHKPRALFLKKKIFTKSMNVFISDIYVHSFSIKVAHYIKNTYLKEIGPFLNIKSALLQ